MSKGIFIVIDGLDGSGKSEMAKLLGSYISSNDQNCNVLITREPSEGMYGKEIRNILAHEADPKIKKKAKFFDEISPMEMVKRGLKVMDLTAITLAMENKIPVVVFDVFQKGNLKKLLLGKKIGSEVKMA